MMKELKNLIHTIQPVFDRESRVLILGSFPSEKSRESGFYYGHPQNRFWRVVATVLGEKNPETLDEKKGMLLRRHIALWDVVASCEIRGSSDGSIREVSPNDVGGILGGGGIRSVFTNGKTADALYRRYLLPVCGRVAVCLPSTSPANAQWSIGNLCEAWSVLAQAVGERS